MPATEEFQSIGGPRLYLDDLESVHLLLKERAQEVVIRVGQDGEADDVEDLRGARPEDLKFVRMDTKEPGVEVQFGSPSYVRARDDSQEARELIRDVRSLVKTRSAPWYKSLAAGYTVILLGIGPGVALEIVSILDAFGLISASDRVRALIGTVALPTMLVGLIACTLGHMFWFLASRATAVMPYRRKEIWNLRLQNRSGAPWQLITGSTSSRSESSQES